MGEMDAQGEGFCEGPSEKGNLLSHTKKNNMATNLDSTCGTYEYKTTIPFLVWSCITKKDTTDRTK